MMRNWTLQPATDLGLPYRQRLESPQREPGLAEWLMHQLTWSSLSVFLRLHQDIKIFGRQHLPAKPPFVIVANHTSHLDALALGTALGIKCRGTVSPLAAADTFFHSPIAAMFSAYFLNATPVQRSRMGSHALRTMREQLLYHEACYLLFPEGTRSRDGSIGRFKPGIGTLVAGTRIPVIPCHISGAYASWPACQKGPSPGHLSLRFGQAMSFETKENDRSGWRETADELEQAVNGLAADRSPLISPKEAALPSRSCVTGRAGLVDY